MMKKWIIILETKRIDKYNSVSVEKLLKRVARRRIIKNFLYTHDLVDEEIFSNDCYRIVIGKNRTIVYLNPDYENTVIMESSHNNNFYFELVE